MRQNQECWRKIIEKRNGMSGNVDTKRKFGVILESQKKKSKRWGKIVKNRKKAQNEEIEIWKVMYKKIQKKLQKIFKKIIIKEQIVKNTEKRHTKIEKRRR